MSSFWSSTTAKPKRNYTYRATIGGGEAFWVKAVTLPSFDVSNTEIHHFDNRYYFPGRVTWNPVSFTMVDPIAEDIAAQVSGFLAGSGYNVPSTHDGKSETVNRAKAITAMGIVKIEVYDPAATGGAGKTIVETWTLNNVFIESAKYGDLAYDNDELKTIELTVRYDYATHDEGGLG